jgi:N-acetyl-alpha-D-muramate 1-phosphate uridylyltransferase
MRHRAFPLMLFAAGFGTRMRALTADRPKPLIPVLGRPLLDRALDLAQGAGAGPIVVNTHYLGAMIETHLGGTGVLVSPEPEEILETGGGLKQALPMLGPGPVMTLNPDAVWRGENPLTMLSDAWDERRMDALLLVQEASRVKGRSGKADFQLDADGRITRASGPEGVLYLGAQILRTELVASWPERVFSLNRIWDQMITEGRAYALPYHGDWCDVGSPEGLAAAEALLGGST